MRVIVEAFVVGLAMTVLFAVIHYVLMVIPATEKISMEMHVGGPLQVFLAGFIGHFVFERTGANKWYCKHGAACVKRNNNQCPLVVRSCT